MRRLGSFCFACVLDVSLCAANQSDAKDSLSEIVLGQFDCVDVADAKELPKDSRGQADESTKGDPQTEHPVIDLMTAQRGLTQKGGTMRLGAYPCAIEDGTLARKVYKRKKVSERHRHRYEFNNGYRGRLEEAGLVFSGVSPDGSLIEMVELREHPFFIACQFHPEFRSRPIDPHPLFRGLVKAALHVRSGERETPLLGSLKVVKG